MNPFLYIPNFIGNYDVLFRQLRDEVDWDNRMKSRKTASFGVPYDYSQITYPFQEFPKKLAGLMKPVSNAVGFQPNNCLLNYYPDGQSSMGFHSDTATGRQTGTGVAIISLGSVRQMRLKRKEKAEETFDISLESGSLIYLDDETQTEWLHAIPKMPSVGPRISLSFRAIEG